MTEATSREWADSVRGWGFPAFAKVMAGLKRGVGGSRVGPGPLHETPPPPHDLPKWCLLALGWASGQT